MADLSAFATKDNADEGVVLPVVIKGKQFPIAIKLFGSDSDVVKEYERKAIRKLNIGKNGKSEINDDAFEELLNSKEGVLVRIGGLWSYNWEEEKVDESDPVTLGDIVLGCDKISYKLLIEKVPAIKDWIMDNSNDRNNFLSVGKKN